MLTLLLSDPSSKDELLTSNQETVEVEGNTVVMVRTIVVIKSTTGAPGSSGPATSGFQSRNHCCRTGRREYQPQYLFHNRRRLPSPKEQGPIRMSVTGNQ